MGHQEFNTESKRFNHFLTTYTQVNILGGSVKPFLNFVVFIILNFFIFIVYFY